MSLKPRREAARPGCAALTFFTSSPWLTLAEAAEYLGVCDRVMRGRLKGALAQGAKGVCGSGANVMIKKDFLNEIMSGRED
ncbi:hypothetical protein AAU61_07120 [Desulfocarbo indianensis]|nr:hypothetical protein AAU61_07120 [Desulfocarbo indianensis]